MIETKYGLNIEAVYDQSHCLIVKTHFVRFEVQDAVLLKHWDFDIHPCQRVDFSKLTGGTALNNMRPVDMFKTQKYLQT